eukprot:g10395.t1 g10395   contig4:1789466-1789818(-)
MAFTVSVRAFVAKSSSFSTTCVGGHYLSSSCKSDLVYNLSSLQIPKSLSSVSALHLNKPLRPLVVCGPSG